MEQVYDSLVASLDTLKTKIDTRGFWVPQVAPKAKCPAVSVAKPTLPDIVCSICLEGFCDPNCSCVKLSRCADGHFFHLECISAALKERSKCPFCNLSYTEAATSGMQPDGMMQVRSFESFLPGEEVSTLTYVVDYIIPSGIQDERHPNPSEPFSGTARRTYFPGGRTDKGREVLKKLLMAWDRRMIFSVGRSLTTNIDNTIVWAGIHHKTRVHGGPAVHAYPDPEYLDRVLEELNEVL